MLLKVNSELGTTMVGIPKLNSADCKQHNQWSFSAGGRRYCVTSRQIWLFWGRDTSTWVIDHTLILMETLEMTTRETTTAWVFLGFFVVRLLHAAPHNIQTLVTANEKRFSYNQSGICSARWVCVERRCLFANYTTPSAVISVQSTLQWNNCTHFEEASPQRDRKRFAAAVWLPSLPTVTNSACHPSSTALHLKIVHLSRSMCCSGGEKMIKQPAETNRRRMWHSKGNISLSAFWSSNSLSSSHESELKKKMQ